MSVPQRAEGALVRLAASLPSAPLGALAGPGGILVLAPHPDDETLGCGAAIMAALAAGRPVTVALLTGGGASHPRSREYPPEAMVKLRRQEFALALARLGEAGGAPIESRYLDLADAAVPHGEAGLSPVAASLCDMVLATRIDTVWATWRGDPHTDHVAAARLADLLVRRCAEAGRALTRRDYAVWGRFGDAPPASPVLAFAPGHWQAAKADAMEAYASQLTQLVRDDPDGFTMPPALTRHFAEAPEVFVAEEGHA